jgi:transcriptional regulator
MKRKHTEKRKNWYIDEEQELYRLVNEGYNSKEIADKLGRTESSVRSKRNTMDIKMPAGRYRYLRDSVWTDDDVATLIKMTKEGYTDKEIGKTIGRSVAAVCQKRERLNIKKSHNTLAVNNHKNWSADEVQMLIDMTNKGYKDDEISAKLGRTKTSIQVMRQKVKVNIRSGRGDIHREFTPTTDMLLVMLVNEDDASPAYIAWLLHRSKKDIERRIAELQESGMFDKIHNALMLDSIYAIKMRRKANNVTNSSNKMLDVIL